MAIEFSVDQQHAIDAKGTILVSAAAGSGKTAVLTERVATMLADEKNPINADRLLIVTFTNASALEMRVRISKRFDELCSERKGNNYLLKQKVLLKNAKICTIDSYCIELVRSYFATLGINHDFSIAEDSQTAAIMDLALDKVLTPRYIEKSSEFNSLCLLFGVDKSDKGLSEAVFKIHNYCMCMSQPNKWLDTAADGYFCDNIADCGFAKVILDYITEVLLT